MVGRSSRNKFSWRSILLRIDCHCLRTLVVGSTASALLLMGCGLSPASTRLPLSANSQEFVAPVAVRSFRIDRRTPRQRLVAPKGDPLRWRSPAGDSAGPLRRVAWNANNDSSKTDRYNLKAEALYNEGERTQAVKIWERNLRRRPDHLPSLYNLAKAYLNANRFKDAAEYFATLIRNDSVDKSYVQARFLGPWAYYKQYSRLSPRYAKYLSDYLKSGDPTYRKQAEALFRIVQNPVVSTIVTDRLVEQIETSMVHNNRNIIHFWAEWCRPCLRELTDLFRFGANYPGIHLWVVSIDVKGDKERADRRLNQLFSPFKASPNANIRFLHDPNKQLWQQFVPDKDQAAGTVPKTVILKGSQTVGYIPHKADWTELDPGMIWSGTIEPEGGW